MRGASGRTVNLRLAALLAIVLIAWARISANAQTTLRFVDLAAGRTSMIEVSSKTALEIRLPPGVSNVDLRLVDRSPSAFPATLVLVVDGAQRALSQAVPTAAEVDAGTMSASASLLGAIGHRNIVVLYNGVGASHFTRASLIAKYRYRSRATTSSLVILYRPNVTTAAPGTVVPALSGSPFVAVSLSRNGRTFGTGIPFGPGMTFENQVEKSGYDPRVDTNRIFLGSGDLLLQYVGGGAYSGVELALPQNARKPLIAGLATLNLADDPQRPMVYVADMACGACRERDDLGIVSFDAAPFEGVAGDSILSGINLVRLANSSTARVRGPVLGICAIGPRQGSPSQTGTLLVATRNGIYALDLAEHRQNARFQVNHVRRVARLRLGAAPTGVVADHLFARANAIFVGDAADRVVRRVDLRSGAVTTYAHFPGSPSGITVDPFSGILYVAVPALRAVYAVPPNGSPRIAAASLPALMGLAFDPQSAAVVATGSTLAGRLMFVR